MSREEELTSVREQVGILAEQVMRLLDMISRQDENGLDSALAEEKLAVLETLLWKRARQSKLVNARYFHCVAPWYRV